MRSFRVSSLCLPVLLIAVPAVTHSEPHALRPGQYEMKTEMKMEGVDREIPPTTRTHCFSDADVKDYKRMAQEGQGRNRDCEMTDMKTSGSHMSWSMTCKGGAKGSADMTYGGDGYEMTMNMETPGGPHGPMKMKIHTTGKRLGDCK